MTERVMTDANGRKYITTEQFKPDWDAMAVLVEQSQEQAAKIEQLEKKLAELSLPEYDRAIITLRAALEQQAETPPEWPLIKNILAEYGLSAICFVAEWKAAQQQAEPTCPECKAKVLFECVACSSNNYPPKRPWVGLTEEEKKHLATAAGCTEDDDGHIVTEIFRLAEAKLKGKNL